MYSVSITLFLMLSSISSQAVSEPALSSSIKLSEEERDWIAAHPEILVGNETDWPPFDFAEDGVPKGYSIDLVRLLSEKAGFNAKFINGYTWSELLEMFKQGELDVLPAMAPSSDRVSFTNFTKPYIDYPLVIVVREDGEIKVENIEDLNGKSVAVVKGYYYEKTVREKYPEINIVPVSGFREGLESVQDDRAFAFIGSRPVVLYTKKEYFLYGLKIAGTANLGEAHQRTLVIGVNKNKPLLYSIINKSLAAITEEEINNLRQRWVFDGAKPVVVQVDSTQKGELLPVFTAGLILFVLIMGLIFMRLWKLQGEKKAGLILIISVLIVLVSAELLVVNLLEKNSNQLAGARLQQFESFRLADEFRQSSDDITRMARTYVVTGNPRFLDYFEQIILIRDGKSPRPIDYTDIYWDYVTASGRKPRADEKAVSLEALMQQMNFSEDEFSLLRKAKQESDTLIELEDRAIHLLRGLYPDKSGNYTVRGKRDYALARALLHGDEYHKAKGKIMDFVGQFNQQLSTRSQREIAHLKQQGANLMQAAIVLSVVSLIAIGMLLILAAAWVSPNTGKEVSTAYLKKLSEHFLAKGTVMSTVWRSWPLFTIAGVACVLIAGFAARNMDELESRTRDEIYNTLSTVLHTTEKALDDWLIDRLREGHVWAQHHEVYESVERLVNVGINSKDLLSDASQDVLKSQFTHLMTDHTYDGYLVVRPDGLIMSSDQSDRVGTYIKAPSEKQLLKNSMQDPLYSAVGLPNKEPDAVAKGENDRPLLQVGAAIINNKGRVLGVLVLFIDPEKTFTRILQRGRMGNSGESYAFNKKGQLISESRFDGHLREMGLVDEGERGILNIEIRDPGGNMVLGYRPNTSRGNQSLTKMASAATAGHSGYDLDGYNDYRGVPVIGAWSWNELYGFGMTTEIDVAEAYASFWKTRLLTVASTLLTVSLIILLVGFFIRNRFRMELATEELTYREKELEKAYDIITVHKERMEEELNIGREIQMSMVPLMFPVFKERKEFIIWGALQPAREVGGDFYDFFFIRPDRFCICIADVSGKGVPSALYMAVAKTQIKSRATDDYSTASILTQVNDELSRDNKEAMFVTVFLAILDLKSGNLVFTNAGHNPPYILRKDGEVEILDDRNGPVVGAVTGITYSESTAMLEEGDRIFTYTDGVTEAMNSDDELFSDKKLRDILTEKSFVDVKSLVNSIVQEVEDFTGDAPQTDDITILTLEYNGFSTNTEKKVVVSLKNKIEEIEHVKEELTNYVEKYDVQKEIGHKFNLVIDELMTNIIYYAFNDEKEHEIGVHIRKVCDRLSVTIIDDGIPFNPFGIDPPNTSLPLDERSIGGLGIHLVKTMMDEYAYHRRTGKNVITLIKWLDTEKNDTH